MNDPSSSNKGCLGIIGVVMLFALFYPMLTNQIRNYADRETNKKKAEQEQIKHQLHDLLSTPLFNFEYEFNFQI